MTYGEAINQLNSVVIYHEAKCTREALDIAIKCIEKQIPMKPTIIDYMTVHCRNCGFTMELVHKPKYCQNCGQAIDWSD